jgi:hypothetical protein
MKIKISDIKPNPSNPRIIKDDKFKKLVQSIKDFPQMLELRPIVINSDNIVLGGNMRLRACKEAGLKEVPVMRADDLTPEQQAEFIIKDNVSFGEWDWDILANEYESESLEDWGISLPTSWGVEDAVMDTKEVDKSEYMAIVVVAYEDINDLDKITSLYDLTRIDINESIKSQVTSQQKAYVFKK